jgi:NAD(P)-dependent dehydrogenase (short-subunit alcohol dehydrogenase family)
VADVALVTGATRGIGREIALGLARDGLRLGVLGRDEVALRSVAGECDDAGADRTATAVVDVTDTAAVAAAVARIEDELGPVELVIGNAGIREDAPAPLWEADADAWWRVVETNLRGVLTVVHAALPGMVSRGRGRILHVGSGMGQRPNADWSAYAVSKAGLSRLTDSLAAMLAGTGVTVVEMSPGLVRTDMTEHMWGPPDEQPWNDVDRMVDAVRRFARGDLDALHGRFVHAAKDDLDALVDAAPAITEADARTLRLRPYGPDDPLG